MEEPYIWLQEGETEGTAWCGCQLKAQHKDGGPAMFLCPDHSTGSDPGGLEARNALLEWAVENQ
tara:strand:- start:2640 stop:2831 length:192 start_codon:yes stop_codon:yes gene_type:complete